MRSPLDERADQLPSLLPRDNAANANFTPSEWTTSKYPRQLQRNQGIIHRHLCHPDPCTALAYAHSVRNAHGITKTSTVMLFSDWRTGFHQMTTKCRQPHQHQHSQRIVHCHPRRMHLGDRSLKAFDSDASTVLSVALVGDAVPSVLELVEGVGSPLAVSNLTAVILVALVGDAVPSVLGLAEGSPSLVAVSILAQHVDDMQAPTPTPTNSTHHPPPLISSTVIHSHAQRNISEYCYLIYFAR